MSQFLKINLPHLSPVSPLLSPLLSSLCPLPISLPSLLLPSSPSTSPFPLSFSPSLSLLRIYHLWTLCLSLRLASLPAFRTLRTSHGAELGISLWLLSPDPPTFSLASTLHSGQAICSSALHCEIRCMPGRGAAPELGGLSLVHLGCGSSFFLMGVWEQQGRGRQPGLSRTTVFIPPDATVRSPGGAQAENQGPAGAGNQDAARNLPSGNPPHPDRASLSQEK